MQSPSALDGRAAAADTAATPVRSAAGMTRRRRVAAFAALILLPLGAVSFYLLLGSPKLPGQALEARRDGRVEGNQEPLKRRTSLLLEAQMHPLATAAVLGSVAAGALFLWAREESRDVGTAEAERRIKAAGMS